MQIENTYDEVLFAATVGVEPDDEDLAKVQAPPGEDESVFRRKVRRTAAEIAALRRDGHNGEARRLADQAAAAYSSAFVGPAPVVVEYEDSATITARMFSR